MSKDDTADLTRTSVNVERDVFIRLRKKLLPITFSEWLRKVMREEVDQKAS